MSIEFRNGPYGGVAVLCKWCNQKLTTGSNSDYKRCDNCGGLHGINEPEPPIYKSVYNWYYIKSAITKALII